MKILFYLSRFPGWGGIETITEMVGSRLSELGYQLSILTHVQQNRPSQLMEKANYYLMPDAGSWDTAGNREYAVRVMNELHPDVVIYQDSYAGTDGILSAMKKVTLGSKIVVFEHNTPLYTRKTLSLLKRAPLPVEVYRRLYSRPRQLREDRRRHLALLKMCDKYVLLSKAYISELEEVCGILPSDELVKKISFINNPILPLDPVKSDRINMILFVGQINGQKRVDIMLDIWGTRLSSNYEDWTFAIVGDGLNREAVHAQMTNGHFRRVQFCGYQVPTAYYQKAKVFWMTSVFEGWPMTLLEAMQQGCVPVVMDTFASVHDIIDDGINGYVVSADDVDAFANKTQQLMNDDVLRERMAEAAREKSTRFNVDNIIDKWVALLNDL